MEVCITWRGERLVTNWGNRKCTSDFGDKVSQTYRQENLHNNLNWMHRHWDWVKYKTVTLHRMKKKMLQRRKEEMWYSHVDAELWIRLSRTDVKDLCQDSTRGQVEASTKKAGQQNRIIRFQEQKCRQCWRRMKIKNFFFLNFANKRSQESLVNTISVE